MEENIKILSEKEIEEKLKEFPGWIFKNNKISKEFKFEDFMESLAFVVRLSSFCEKIDHHPDIHIFYSKVLFELSRYDVGGKVTDKDFKVAEEIERLYSKRKNA